MARPTKYKKSYCEDLILHGKDGFSFECFGPSIGVWQATIYNWLKATKDDGDPKHPEFLEAKKECDAQCLFFYEKQGRNGMTGAGKYKNFNATVWIFMMKNRFRWRNEQQIVTIDETLKEPADMKDTELAARHAHALKVIEQHEAGPGRSDSNSKGSGKKKKTKGSSKKRKGKSS